ncbi:MAG: PhzF family phenazine biosynthesis protein [Desulfatirhabdiaceae bacterium]
MPKQWDHRILTDSSDCFVNIFSKTAFVVKEGLDYKLRWFTPGGEIDWFGHAMLACLRLKKYPQGQGFMAAISMKLAG